MDFYMLCLMSFVIFLLVVYIGYILYTTAGDFEKLRLELERTKKEYEVLNNNYYVLVAENKQLRYELMSKRGYDAR